MGREQHSGSVAQFPGRGWRNAADRVALPHQRHCAQSLSPAARLPAIQKRQIQVEGAIAGARQLHYARTDRGIQFVRVQRRSQVTA